MIHLFSDLITQALYTLYDFIPLLLNILLVLSVDTLVSELCLSQFDLFLRALLSLYLQFVKQFMMIDVQLCQPLGHFLFITISRLDAGLYYILGQVYEERDFGLLGWCLLDSIKLGIHCFIWTIYISIGVY